MRRRITVDWLLVLVLAILLVVIGLTFVKLCDPASVCIGWFIKTAHG